MAAFANLGFETGSAGIPTSWTRSSLSSLFSIAEYSSPAQPWENFEIDWNTNEDYLFEFTLMDIDFATYTTNLVTQKRYENFEEKWNQNEAYLYALGSQALASYDNGPGNSDFETFSGGWNSNEDYLFSFVGIGTDLVAGTFDGEPKEDFEDGWNSNESYEYALSGIEVCAYAPALDLFESFEDGWDDNVMSTL